MKRQIVREVWERASNHCEYCQVSQDQDLIAFQIDHVIAETHGGTTTLDNLALACFLDDSYKGANLAGVDPVTGRIARLFNPRFQHWHRHFRWDGPVLMAKTASGRATIDVLRINLPHRIAQRAALIHEGVFPP